MKNEILIGDRKIEYTHKISKKSKRLRLAVYCGGEFIVTSPRFVTKKRQKLNMKNIKLKR